MDPRETILIVFNHGFSSTSAGRYEANVPPILLTAEARNRDVVVFGQVRNASRLASVDHSSYIEAAIADFQSRLRIPVENIILVGQSCGGWGSLQAAAFTYPNIGGVLAFAPTCHGRLPHATEVRLRRAQENAQLAERARFPGSILLYEGDSYYTLEEWARFEEENAGRAPALRIERVSRARVLEVCGSRCAQDSHGAYLGPRFSEIFYERHLQPLIERVRARGAAGGSAGAPLSSGDAVGRKSR